MDTNAASQAFEKITCNIGAMAHGHRGDGLNQLREFLSCLKKRKKDFLKTRLFQKPKSWDENRERGIWENQTVAEQNKYPFIQGDIVRSKNVIGPNGEEDHNGYWLILSVDCDCARRDFEYFMLARINEVDPSHVSLATSFKSPKWFPIPPIREEDEEWFVADLITPFYLTNRYSFFCDVIKSMKVEAWHILNALLQERYTRSINIEESKKLRGL